MVEHHRREPVRCPYCGERTDCDTPVYADIKPTPGDVAVCFYCAGIAIYTEDGQRKPTEDERVELLKDEHVTRAVSAILGFRAVDL